MLREVCAWRDQKARDTNTWPNLIAREDVLLALAVQKPQTMQQLKGIQGVRPIFVERCVREWGGFVSSFSDVSGRAPAGVLVRGVPIIACICESEAVNHSQAQGHPRGQAHRCRAVRVCVSVCA